MTAAIVIKVPPAVATALAIVGLILFVVLLAAAVLSSQTGRRRVKRVLAVVGAYVLLATVIGGVRACQFDRVAEKFEARMAKVREAASGALPADGPLARACAGKLETGPRESLIGYVERDQRIMERYSSYPSDLPEYAVVWPDRDGTAKAAMAYIWPAERKSIAMYAVYMLWPGHWFGADPDARRLDTLLDARYVAVGRLLPVDSGVSLAVRVLDFSTGAVVCEGRALGKAPTNSSVCEPFLGPNYCFKDVAANAVLDGACDALGAPLCTGTGRYVMRR
jgi:hypothetical protein